MAVGRRTLQLRLQEEGFSFSVLVEAEQREQALAEPEPAGLSITSGRTFLPPSTRTAMTWWPRWSRAGPATTATGATPCCGGRFSAVSTLPRSGPETPRRTGAPMGEQATGTPQRAPRRAPRSWARSEGEGKKIRAADVPSPPRNGPDVPFRGGQGPLLQRLGRQGGTRHGSVRNAAAGQCPRQVRVGSGAHPDAS